MNFKKQEMQIEEIRNSPTGEKFQIIQDLAKELTEISRLRKDKYPFKDEYLDLTINKIKANPGKFLIDLENLPDNFILRFNEYGKGILKNLVNFVKTNYGLDRVNRKLGVNFYLFNESINKWKGGLRVDTLKKYLNFVSNQKLAVLDINEIKKSVNEIKPSIKSRAIKIDGLPIDLREEKWASLIGIILDSNLREFDLVAEDEAFAMEVVSSIKNVGVSPNVKFSGNLVRIKGHSIIGQLLNIAGFDRYKKQLIANNCLPYWIFYCSKKYHAVLLSKFLDTEGYVPKGRSGIRIAQASLIELTEEERKFVLRNCSTKIIRPSNKESKVIIFSNLTENLKEKVLSNPSLMLISIQLLLRKYGINSKVYPINVYISSNGVASISWHLAIIGFTELKKFYDLCNEYISIKYKRGNLKKILEKQKVNCLPMGLRNAYYLVNALKIQSSKGYFTTRDLIYATGRKKKTVYDTVGYLARLNLIKTIKKMRIKLWNVTGEGMKKVDGICIDKERWDYLFK